MAEWLGDLDVRLRAGALDPQEMRTATEELQSELAVTAVTLADVTRLAGVITERARRQRQRTDVQQAVQRRQQELDAARTRLEKRRAQVRYLGRGGGGGSCGGVDGINRWRLSHSAFCDMSRWMRRCSLFSTMIQ